MPAGKHINPEHDLTRTQQMLSGLERQYLSIKHNQMDSDYQALEYDIYDRIKFERQTKHVEY